MLSGARRLMSKISSKFFHEVMPVALASVIGTMLINHSAGSPLRPTSSSRRRNRPPPPGGDLADAA